MNVFGPARVKVPLPAISKANWLYGAVPILQRAGKGGVVTSVDYEGCWPTGTLHETAAAAGQGGKVRVMTRQIERAVDHGRAATQGSRRTGDQGSLFYVGGAAVVTGSANDLGSLADLRERQATAAVLNNAREDAVSIARSHGQIGCTGSGIVHCAVAIKRADCDALVVEVQPAVVDGQTAIRIAESRRAGHFQRSGLNVGPAAVIASRTGEGKCADTGLGQCKRGVGRAVLQDAVELRVPAVAAHRERGRACAGCHRAAARQRGNAAVVAGQIERRTLVNGNYRVATEARGRTGCDRAGVDGCGAAIGVVGSAERQRVRAVLDHTAIASDGVGKILVVRVIEVQDGTFGRPWAVRQQDVALQRAVERAVTQLERAALHHARAACPDVQHTRSPVGN